MNNFRRRGRLILILVYIVVQHPAAFAQGDSTSVNKRRLTTVAVTTGLGYTAGIIGLSHLWYSQSERQSFHFFNDNAEWKQMDKAGHLFSGYYLSYATSRALQWCDVQTSVADIAGAITGFALLMPIEILDGHSPSYGASAGDLVANAAGSLLFLGQQRWWNEQRLIPRFSFRTTPYASLRPDVLGDDLAAQVLKDYNGQIYWLSVDMDKFIRFPEWLNIAIGYGAHDMVYARDAQNSTIGFRPYRQLYLALDPDLSAIQTKSRLIKSLLFVAGMIKIPAPGLEWSQGKIKAQPLAY